MKHTSYHATNEKSMKSIIGPPKNVDVTLGKGELGKGFYTGSNPSIAHSWANIRFGDENPHVLEFEIEQMEIMKLNVHHIKTRDKVHELHEELKDAETRDEHLFGVDYVLAPFETIDGGLQYKFESQKAQTLINKSTINCMRCY